MKTFEKLIQAKSQLDFFIEKLEIELKDKIDFKFAIVYQESDGWCILKEDCTDLSTLRECIKVIEQKGVLSVDDFDELGI
jgi:hypothetical protein